MKQLLFFVGYVGYALLVAPLTIWLMVNAQTAVGSTIAVFGFLALTLPVLWVINHQKPRLLLRGLIGVSVLLLVGLGTFVLVNAPAGNPASSSPVQHHYLQGDGNGRFHPTNIIPESEQVNLAYARVFRANPDIPQNEVEHATESTMNLYRQMEQDPNFHALGSAMNLAYAEVAGRPFNPGHYYLYIPQNAPAEPLPAIVFLHGSGGNFKLYTWIWAQLAEQAQYVIIAPSYGFGNWDEAGAATVLQAIEDAQQFVNLDLDQIYLAGLSNGGLGLSQLGLTAPEMFRGLIFISPVMNDPLVDSSAFRKNWANRPILLISGANDKLIPLSYVDARVASLAQAPANLTTLIYPNEDHFLIFSQPEKLMADVATWLEAQE